MNQVEQFAGAESQIAPENVSKSMFGVAATCGNRLGIALLGADHLGVGEMLQGRKQRADLKGSGRQIQMRHVRLPLGVDPQFAELFSHLRGEIIGRSDREQGPRWRAPKPRCDHSTLSADRQS